MAKWWPGVTRSSRSYNHDQRIESAGEGVAKSCPAVARSSRSYNHDQRIESAGEGVAKWWPGVTRSSRSYNQYGESRRKPRASARGGCQQRIESARKGVTQVSCARDDSVTAGHHLSHTLPSRSARICRGLRDGHDRATAGHHLSHTLPSRFARSLRSLAHPSHALASPPAATSRGARHHTAPHHTALPASHRTTPHCTASCSRSARHHARWSVVCRVAQTTGNRRETPRRQP